MAKQSKRRRHRAKNSSERHRSAELTSPAFEGMDPALLAAYADYAVGDPRFKIAYLIPHRPQDLNEASLFGWYTPGLIEAAGPLRLASVLPADIREPFTSEAIVLLNRQVRRIWPIITPIQLDAVAEAFNLLQTPFQVYISNDEHVAKELDVTLANANFPVLHFSTVPGGNRLPFAAANVARVCVYVRSVLEYLATKPSWQKFVREARDAITKTRMRRPMKHYLPQGFHNVVAPNELALMAFGRKLFVSKRISQPGFRPPVDPEVYVARICQSADAVTEERKRLLAQAPIRPIDHRLILATASAYWGIFKRWRTMVRDAEPGLKKGLEHALSAVVQGKSYFDTIDISEQGKPIVEPAYAYLAEARAMDLSAFTSALSLLSTKSLVPVLRLEPRLNEARGQIKQIAHCVRSEAQHHYSWKTSRLVRKLGRHMRGLINSSFLQRIDAPELNGRIEGMKLVSDLPIELLPSGGMPLGLRFDVSRLSPIPGNQLIQQCASLPIRLPLSAFEEILVIRSFKPADPLKKVFQTAVDHVLTSDPRKQLKIKYRFVDVQSTDEFVTAINAYDGAALIFDGHGKYDPESGIGSLVLGDEVLDAWSLSRKCTVPPIVMFSACDTHPIDGSHGSVAMAAFNLGARAVLGTMLPIGGVEAAVFNARLALRIEEFMPIALKAAHPSPLTWRAVVSGMIRMSHTQEILRRLMAPGLMGINQRQASQVQLAANTAINFQRSDWYAAFEEELAKCVDRSIESVRDVISKHIGLTDAMKYVHLGNPEDIVIVEETAYHVFERFGLVGDARPTQLDS